MYRGWAVTGGTIATQMAQAGLLIYGFSALALPLEREFGTSRGAVMVTTTCLSLASSALAPLAGRAIDRGSVRRLMLLACAMLAAGFLALSKAGALWQVWTIYSVLLAPANVLLGQLSSAALITRWFGPRRGRAMGISTLGTSLGGFVFPVALAAGTAAFGWRTAAALVGCGAALAVAAIVALAIVDRPADVGLPGEDSYAPTGLEIADEALSASAILAMPAFWIITFGVGIKLATYLGLVNNLAAYGRDLGVGEVAAAGLVSVLSVTSMAGKLGFGWLAERSPLKWLFAGALGLTILAFAGLIAARGYPSLLAACLLLGLATGGMLPLWGLIVAQVFGQASFGRALGLTNLIMVPLTATASPLAGWSYDATGGYRTAILASMALLALATALIALLPRQGR
ncbi:MFS transporter [Novosphingobium sp. Gsoil 351]|uniref:MFS transporter n=1 Tax=Novosphingobium sp. Gsoil 351 TaxID=2675225 RepID=UPI0012B4E452|nr:MFS transporter [Novosphingobium sp. Gsoil 351]QGN55837.1 MFS transporter [Novosphingobium sp. Gsoil 351]